MRSLAPFARASLACTTVLVLSAACGSRSDTAADTGSSSTSTPRLRVALLTAGSVSDQAWNAIAYTGLLAIRDSLGAEISNIETKTPAEFEENFRQYGAQGYQLVFGHGFEFQDAAMRVAPSYPKTAYVITSGRAVAANVAGVAFAFEQASYQAGILAAALTKSKVIGMIGGTEIPPVKASFTAFQRGAHSVDPKIRVLTSYIGNWEDVSAGKEQALAQIGRGVDLIFQNADAAGLGVIQAVRERKILAFGANANQNHLAPEVIVASVVIDLPKALMGIAREVQRGGFSGRVINLGIRDSIVRLEMNAAFDSRVPAPIKTAIDSVGRALGAGTFRALDDILAGADTAKAAVPPKP